MKLHATPGRLAAMLLAAALNAGAAPASPAASSLGPVQNPLWLRYSSISPDGSQIAFAYQGNLYLVPSAGGAAPKAIPSDPMVGIEAAVRVPSPGSAAAIVQLLICAKHSPIPAPIRATQQPMRGSGPSTT